MAWTETCKIDFQKQVEHKKEQGYKTKDALVELSKDSGIPIGTLKNWLYPEQTKRRIDKQQEKNRINATFDRNELSNNNPTQNKELEGSNLNLSQEFKEIDKAAYEQKLEIVKEIKENKRESIKEKQEEKRANLKPVELPKDIFQIIYADPPWHYEFSQTVSREIENRYPTMCLEEIKNLSIPAICAEDCVLFLWATSPKLVEGLGVMESWGFQYKTCAVWDKQKIGMGYYFRQQHEVLLIGKKGSPPVPNPSNRVSSVISSPREKHSKKPDIIYEIIEKMYPDEKKIELFNRQSREGWDSFGNEG